MWKRMLRTVRLVRSRWWFFKACMKDHYTLYNVVTALRGPDLYECGELDRLKYVVTTRLRHIAFGNCACPGQIRSDVLISDEVQSLYLQPDTLRNYAERLAAEHVLLHLIEAVEVTMDHPIWGGIGSMLRNRLADYKHAIWSEQSMIQARSYSPCPDTIQSKQDF